MQPAALHRSFGQNSPTAESMGFKMPPPPPPPEDDDAAMLDVMRGHGYQVKDPPPGFSQQTPPLPPPAPAPAPASPALALVSPRKQLRAGDDDDDDNDDESLMDAMKRNGFHSFSAAQSSQAPTPPAPAPAPAPPVLSNLETATTNSFTSFGSSGSVGSTDEGLSTSASWDHHHSSPTLPSFARRPPPPPEDDDDAMLDVMRADGYHVSKPGHAFLLQTRVVAWDRAAWQPDIPREEAALVQSVATFLAQDLGTDGATGQLIHRLSQQGKAENMAMLQQLRGRLESQAIACGDEPGPVSALDTAEGERTLARQRLQQLQAEGAALASLQEAAEKASALEARHRSRLLALLQKLRGSYGDGEASEAAVSECPPPQAGEALLAALRTQQRKDAAALQELTARWEAPADVPSAGSPERLRSLARSKADSAKRERLAVAAAEEKLQRLKLASATPRPPKLCADATRHLDLLEAVRRAIHILQA